MDIYPLYPAIRLDGKKKKEVIDDTAVLAHVSSTAALMRTEPPIDQKKGHIHTLIHPWK